MSNVVESTVVVVPVTVKSPVTVTFANCTLSSVLSPKSTADAATPLVVNATSPCAPDDKEEPEINPCPSLNAICTSDPVGPATQ